MLVALVVGVRDEGHAGGDELGAGGLDEHRFAGAVGRGVVVRHPVVGARVVAGLELGLRDRRLVRDVPQRRGILQVRLAPGDVAQEGALRDALRLGPDRRVLLGPVDGQSERAPQALEDLLVLLDQLVAQLDEVAAADRHLVLRVRVLRRRVVGVVRERGVTADAVVVLHASLGGQPVVVPAHRVEDLAATHALVPGDQVGVRVREHVADVERTGDRRRRGVDRVDLVARLAAIEAVRSLLLPALRPCGLQAFEHGLVGN